ncbi:MAG: COG2426 family protein [Candidatus Syntropharchaeia archaeon]
MPDLFQAITIILIAASPIAELRGAIPVALFLQMNPVEAFFLSVIGNTIPVLFLLLFLEPLSNWLRKFKIFDYFFDWLFSRTRNHGERVEKYGALGLIPLVAIPLPMTGAWTGCAAAFVFGIKFRYAFPAIFAGILMAGMIVMCLTLDLIHVLSGYPLFLLAQLVWE